MQEEVEAIPLKIEAAQREGAAEKARLLNKAYQYEAELENKNGELKRASLETEYEHLLKKYEAVKGETAELSKRLEQCNMESRKLTSDTVRFIGGINILNADNRTADPAGKSK